MNIFEALEKKARKEISKSDFNSYMAENRYNDFNRLNDDLPNMNQYI